ncbi:MAG: sulfite reductase subunit alpha [Isosphaeraceae bacterium]|nr:sulfite reductase subunit alpha [Isosphaeraceae bacterium]
MDISLIPDTAPFNSEQRAWLNGFLAGWLGLVPNGASSAPPLPPVPSKEAVPEPWHDPALALDDRLRLAEGQPLPGRLMAAMAQLDCGSCGYLCRTYAEAIAGGTETRLSLCSPGGSETSKTLKRLVKERAPSANGHANGAAVNGVAKPVTDGWSRENPYSARLVRTVNLNRTGSEKETRHIEIELGADGPSYAVGDSLGIYPENCGALVDELIAALGARGDEEVSPGTSLRTILSERSCLSEVTEGLLQGLAAAASDPAEAAGLRALIDDDGPIAGCDVLDVLQRFPSARPHLADFVACLSPLRPRLYSISSSPKRHVGQVHLTVRRVFYEHNGRSRKGVASTMLADRVAAGSALRLFVQKSHGFRLPSDPTAPMIMIGPGTGIAPFRAFLHERDVTGATGKNWLFFGDQRGETDFLYEDELAEFLRRGVLTRLDTAFSRDQEMKVYVQHRLLERGAELFAWLEEGAFLYVCGDAKRMAADVDRALRAVVSQQGAMSPETADAYVASLAKSGRYKKDVY